METDAIKINVCLIGKHQLLRSSIKTLLRDSHISMVAEEDSVKSLTRLPLTSCHVMVIECAQRMDTFLKLVSDLLNTHPHIKVIALTSGEDDLSMLRSMLEAGISGYLTNDASGEELSHSIRKVHDEGIYVCTAFVMRMLKSPAQATPLQSTVKLKAPELEVLRLIAEGLTNNEIAEKLFLSVRAIENRRKRLLEKTGSINTATLIKFAVKNGLIS